jgi:predicted flap endonuclease-1-like 5' DNA nuclease
MANNLIDIEGIGPKYAKTLGDAGLKTTNDLLKSAGSAAGRKSLAERTRIDASKLLEWVNRADLMRIKGIGSEFSDLLEASGVDTVKELAARVPACGAYLPWPKSSPGQRKPRLCRPSYPTSGKPPGRGASAAFGRGTSLGSTLWPMGFI